MATRAAVIKKIKANPNETLLKMPEDELSDLVLYFNNQYFVKGKSSISDELFDIIKDKLRKLNKNNPALKQVGALVADNKKKVKLPVYMGSMNKIKGDQKAIDTFRDKHDSDMFIVSDKLDGVSALYHVDEEGKQHLYSRGDGLIGQDITHLVTFLPNSFPSKPVKNTMVRGELIISKANFEKIKDLGAKGRNTVAGIVNAKVPNTKILKLVEFRTYSLIQPEGFSVKDQFSELVKRGFLIANNTSITRNDMTLEILSSILIDRRSQSPFEIDGIIVSDNKFHSVVESQNPTYAFAFKSILTMETAEVLVSNVEWNLSKDGYFKPVVQINPVRLNGVLIKRATGFNGDFIESNGIGPGAKIIITRSGDVIPYITKVLTRAEGGPQMPTEKYQWNDTHKEIMVVGESEKVDLKVIVNFFDKLDIKGMSEKSVEKIYNSGFRSIKSILNAQTSDFEKVAGLLNKSKLYDMIHDRIKAVDCITLMKASNAFGHGFGERRITMIYKDFPNMMKTAPTMEELVQVDGISDITASAFLKGLEQFHEFLKLTKLPCKLGSSNTKATKENNKVNENAEKFKDQVIVFSGFRNGDWEVLIKEGGGTVGSSVTKNTTMIVVKDISATTKKIEDAKAKGIHIVSMQNFQNILNK